MARNKRKSIETKKSGISKKTKPDYYTSSWFEAVAEYVKETKTTVLDLSDRGLWKNEVRLVLDFLRDSHVTDLNLEGSSLRNAMADLAPLLIKTNLQKLNVSDRGRCVSKQVGRATTEDLLVLFEVLKDTQITDLSIEQNWYLHFNFEEAQKYISYLENSKLIKLESNLFRFFPPVELAPFLQDYSKTTITCLSLCLRSVDSKDLISLIANLGHSSITYLNLVYTEISAEVLLELAEKLAETKIEKLNLKHNKLKLNNDQLDVLSNGLINSKVTDLDLGRNHFPDFAPLLAKLKDTRIKTLGIDFNSQLRYRGQIFPDSLRHSSLTSLNLRGCFLRDEQGEELMECLRLSCVTKLDIGWNSLGSLTIKKFAENVKYMNLTDLDLYHNPLPLDAFFTFGKCLKESKLTCVGVGDIESARSIDAEDLLSFLKLTKGSSVCQIAMNNYSTSVWDRLPVSEPKALVNTTFTELDLHECVFGDNISSLLSHLKFTAVTHLNLTKSGISDDGAKALAENLKETQIRKLNLDKNLITNLGAKAIALSFKESNLLYLHLKNNKIGNEGLEFLAENAKDTLITVINVINNPGKIILSVDKVLWRNKVSVCKFVNIFKRIAPYSEPIYCGRKEFCFVQDCDDLDVDAFLEKCMWFYKTAVNDSRAIGVLLEEKSLSFSRELIFTLLFEEFPRQFSEFIAHRIEASLTEHVRILEKAEEMGLTAVVESLLLNRPVYMLDKEQGILHPFVYKLLLKYKQPICSLAVEPRGVIKIIEYFTEHADIEGAKDLNSLLRNAKIS